MISPIIKNQYSKSPRYKDSPSEKAGVCAVSKYLAPATPPRAPNRWRGREARAWQGFRADMQATFDDGWNVEYFGSGCLLAVLAPTIGTEYTLSTRREKVLVGSRHLLLNLCTSSNIAKHCLHVCCCRG